MLINEPKLVGIGLYTVPEAARLTKVPQPTIRRWLFGYRSRRNGQYSELPPLWESQIAPVDSLTGLGFALCAHEGVAVEHLRQMFPEDISDAEWIERLAKEGEWAVITQDRLMRNRLEKEAFRRSELTAFVLTKAWASHRYWEKAAQLVRWWPRIMEQAGLVEGGAAFEVPWRFSGKGKFKALRL